MGVDVGRGGISVEVSRVVGGWAVGAEVVGGGTSVMGREEGGGGGGSLVSPSKALRRR